MLNEVARLEKIIESYRRDENFCPDCRDKVRDEPCQRCEAQKWKNKAEYWKEKYLKIKEFIS